jgi:hypothetical protein
LQGGQQVEAALVPKIVVIVALAAVVARAIWKLRLFVA